MPTHRLPTQGVVILQTGQFADAASTSSCYRLEEPILYPTGQKLSSRILQETPPKVNRFGWNLEQCGGLFLTDFGRDPRNSNGLRGIVFPQKCKNSSQNFYVLRLQAVITPQWFRCWKLGQMFPPPWDVYFSFLPLESLQSYFPMLYAAHQKGTYPNVLQRLLSDIVQ